MAKGRNQKLKLMYLAKIFLEETDDEHGLTLQQIIQKLSLYDVNAERKTIYADIDELRNYGIDIVVEKEGKNTRYHIGDREFELAELKLLVDSVQSAKFITEKKSKELIKKLEGLASVNEAKKLQRQVYIAGRVKTMNESIYYNVDLIHTAIGMGRQIRFKYYQWNVKKEMELRHDGAVYEISPWGLLWDDEYYYLIGYDHKSEMIRHYRVDKILNIDITDLPRDGKEVFEKLDMASYTKHRFGMFDGDVVHVELEVDNVLAGVVIDRFGKAVPMIPKDEKHFTTYVDVAISNQFFGWVMAFGNQMKIIAPENVVERMKEEVGKLLNMYK